MLAQKIIESLKMYCENELWLYHGMGKTYGADINQITTRCYGAMMYTCSYLLSAEGCKIVLNWWANEMYPKLKELS